MFKFFKIYFLILLLFLSSCSKDETQKFDGKNIEFKVNKIEVNKDSFDELSQIGQQKFNKLWLQKGGDKLHSLSNVSFKFPLKKIWIFDTDQEISEDFPILTDPLGFNKNIYVLNVFGYLYCLNKKNGSLEWKRKVFRSNENSLLGVGSIVISKKLNSIFLHNGGNEIISLDLETKKINWKKTFEIPFRGSIAIGEDKLLVNDYQGNLLNIDGSNGSILWKRKLDSSSLSIYTNSRPLILDKKVINPGSNGIFHVLNINSGNLIYSDILGASNRGVRFFDNNDIIANPIFKHPYLYITSHSENISAYDLTSYNNVWSLPIGSQNTPVISGKTIFNIDNKGVLFAIDKNNGLVRWKKKFQTEKITGTLFEKKKWINFSGPYLVGNKLLLLDNEQTIYLINPDDGNIESKKELIGNVVSALFFTNQIVFLFSNGKISSYN